MKIKALILAAVMLTAAAAAGCNKAPENSKPAETSAAGSQASSDSSANESKTESSAESKTEDSKEESKESSAPAGTPVDASWFDDAVFVGDSVTLKLSYYAEGGDLGEAKFLCAGSLGYTNALWDIDAEDNVHPVYEGEKYTVDEGCKVINPKKIFVMLGMNDIGLYGVDEAADNMIKLTDKITANCPDAVLYIESVTPMVAGNSLGDLNNENIRAFDEKLKTICAEKGYKYLDVYSAVDDGNGNLVYEYCGDPPSDDNPDAMGLHFTDEGCKVWADYLKANVEA